MIDELKKNVDAEIEIIREISNYTRAIDYSSAEESVLLAGAIKSLSEIFVIINDTIPSLLEERKIVLKDLPKIPNLREVKKKEYVMMRPINLESVKIERFDKKIDVLLNKKDTSAN